VCVTKEKNCIDTNILIRESSVARLQSLDDEQKALREKEIVSISIIIAAVYSPNWVVTSRMSCV